MYEVVKDSPAQPTLQHIGDGVCGGVGAAGVIATAEPPALPPESPAPPTLRHVGAAAGVIATADPPTLPLEHTCATSDMKAMPWPSLGQTQLKTSGKFAVIRPPPYGFFSVMSFVASSLFAFYYDGQRSVAIQSQYDGIRVDFGNIGLYYDSNRGTNWWTYYFEGIERGDTSGQEVILDSLGRGPMIEHYMSTTQMIQVIQKHFIMKSDVRAQINRSLDQLFTPEYFVIGIHYRGTDKCIEAPRVVYERVLERLAEARTANTTHKPVRYFVATDEHDFLTFMMRNFTADMVVFVGDVCRSSAAGASTHVHTHANDRFRGGINAFSDCYLLSCCDFLVRTSSNLSLWSTYFSPRMPVIELSQRH
jgi:hypothetical protein